MSFEDLRITAYYSTIWKTSTVVGVIVLGVFRVSFPRSSSGAGPLDRMPADRMPAQTSIKKPRIAIPIFISIPEKDAWGPP
jgi:hypothetical protein